MTAPARTDPTTAGCSPALACWSPADLPADTRTKRLVDRVVPRTGAGAFTFFVAVAVMVSVAGRIPDRPGLVVVASASGLAGAWCITNFWRCRQAHCVVTGVGWLALAAVAGFETGYGQSVIGGDEDLVFLVILAIALAFEFGVYVTRGTNALTRQQNSRRQPEPPHG